MGMTDAIVNYRRFLKRRNLSSHTVRSYMDALKHFVIWLNVPLEQAGRRQILAYIDHLLDRRRTPKTINCHLNSIRRFYDYLQYEEGIKIPNPVKAGYALRLPKPLSCFLKEEEIRRLLPIIKKRRDRAIFLLMLRCGLRVEEVAELTVGDIDLIRDRIQVHRGKGGKGRMVYISKDACEALGSYLETRPPGAFKKLFLVEKGTYKNKPISVRGIQKRIEYYGRKAGVPVHCHRLRHTMATQLLNADADLATIQDLLGHSSVTTTQRYCKVSNLKVQRDYFNAMEKVQVKYARALDINEMNPNS